MRPVWIALGLGACAADPQQTEEIEALKRRVTSLERRIGEIDGNTVEAARSRGDGERAAKGTVALEGDATKVMLFARGRRVPVPGPVAAGEYVVQVQFGSDTPIDAGPATVVADATLTVTCTAETKSCTTR